MGPYGPSVEERKRVQLKELKEKYGDLPYKELIILANEAMAEKIREFDKKRERRKTA